MISHAETLLNVCSKFQVFISYSLLVIIFLLKSWKKGLWTLLMLLGTEIAGSECVNIMQGFWFGVTVILPYDLLALFVSR